MSRSPVLIKLLGLFLLAGAAAAADQAVAGGAGPAGLTATDTIDAARSLLNQR